MKLRYFTLYEFKIVRMLSFIDEMTVFTLIFIAPFIAFDIGGGIINYLCRAQSLLCKEVLKCKYLRGIGYVEGALEL